MSSTQDETMAAITIQRFYRRNLSKLLRRVTRFVIDTNIDSMFKEICAQWTLASVEQFDCGTVHAWKKSMTVMYAHNCTRTLADMVYLDPCEFSAEIGYANRIGTLGRCDTERMQRLGLIALY